MDSATIFVVGLAVLTASAPYLLNKAQGKSRGGDKGGFYCRVCQKTMVKESLFVEAMPREVRAFLIGYELPPEVVSRFVCPTRHTQIWFVPKLGNTDRSLFVVRNN